MKSTRNRSRLADQGTKEMLPVIFSLAWPTMLEQLMQTAVQYMDTGMVGVLGTSAKSFRTGCADSCDRRNIFYNSDNGTEP